jgi:BsuBI/PstI restriction endonuclease domain
LSPSKLAPDVYKQILSQLGQRLLALDGSQGHLRLEGRCVVPTWSSCHCCSCAARILAAFRQKLHLSRCSDFPSQLCPGEHSELIRDIIEEFAPRFAPNGVLIYAGDTGDKMGYFDHNSLAMLGVTVDNHGKMPDVVIHYTERNWLLLVESVTSHGPVDAKRHEELVQLFSRSSAGLVYVTAFPTRATMARYLAEIAWETEVWVADAPTHLIHFNGVRFLGPYADSRR